MPEEPEFSTPIPVQEERRMLPNPPDDAFVATLKFLMEIQVPKKYQEEFNKYKPALTQALRLGYIPERNREAELNYYLTLFDLAAGYFKMGLPELAREKLRRIVARLGLSCSVEGFQQKVLVTSRGETIVRGLPGMKEEKKKKRFWVF